MSKVASRRALRGEVQVPGDKSIAHRALIFGALANGWTRIAGLPSGADVRATVGALQTLGVSISRNAESAVIAGRGASALDARGAVIDCANSGTTTRMLMGALAGTKVRATLFGDASLSKRPMRRVADPLASFGAKIELSPAGTAPIHIEGTPLHATAYALPVASAQVKSALILAALQAEGTTMLGGEIVSRDHTERMLPVFGGKLEVSNGTIVVPGRQRLRGAFVRVPGDPSSAAFWIGGALIAPNSEVVVRNVSTNPSRLGFVRAVRRMAGDVSVESTEADGEPVGSIRARTSTLRAIELGADEIADILDELPLLGVLATQAHGRTVVCDAQELRVKESDRIEALAALIRALGGTIETFPDGFAIEGPQQLRGGRANSMGDHRIAMSGAIASLAAEGDVEIDDASCVDISYPEFFATFRALETVA